MKKRIRGRTDGEVGPALNARWREKILHAASKSWHKIAAAEHFRRRKNFGRSSRTMNRYGTLPRIDHPHFPRSTGQPSLRFGRHFACGIGRRSHFDRQIRRAGPVCLGYACRGDSVGLHKSYIGREDGVRVAIKLKSRFGAKDDA